jgi:ABC-type transport system involved in multi-copper enzyme maturation permease subunit
VSVPILDQTYQRWSGRREARPPAVILARSQLRLLLARRPIRLLLLAALGFLFVWGALVYVESQTVRVGPLSQIRGVVHVDAASLRTFFVRQRLVHLLLCLAAADLIALDRRHRALQIYLARPVRPVDYVLGKGLALAVPLSLATWIPALVLILFKTALRGEVSWLAAEPWLPASILGYSLLLIGALGMLTLALSSLSSSPRQASALVFAILALTASAGSVLAAVTRSDRWQLLSVNANLDQVASWLFRTEPPHDAPAAASFGVLVALMAAAALVLWQRIRPIEVVGRS